MAIKKVKKVDLKQTVKDMLLDHISQMDLSVETKLPREEELALMFGVSRITIRSVLDDLAGEGNPGQFQSRDAFLRYDPQQWVYSVGSDY